MEVGNCYLITTPPNGKHWFVVAFPISETRHLLLSFSTKREKSDPACILEPGADMPDFIEHCTIIDYRKAMEFTQYGFEDATKRGHCTEAGKVSEELLERILRSGLESRFLKNKWKKVIRETLKEKEES